MGAAVRIGHLYAEEMNIYGDRGNTMTLLRRAEWRGIPASLTPIGRGTTPDPGDFDLLFWGGGQDRDQALVFQDLLERKADFIRSAVAQGTVVLAVCGGFQLLGSYYVTADQKKLPGLGLLDLYTVPGPRRNIGNVLVDAGGLGIEPPTLVGFENHSGKTFLGPGVNPLGRVIRGTGNNGEDGTEGVAQGNLFGTYLHGSLLPKNPQLADLLLSRVLARRGEARLSPLDDTVELAAHTGVERRIRSRR